MATIQEIKTKLLNVNALGRTNLSEKGVKLPETATTYEIMSKIAEISGGGGVEIPAKEEQEKTITITENGTTEILPDTNKALSKVTVVTDVPIGVSENYAEAFNALHHASFMSAVNLERIDFYIANPFISHNGFFRGTSKLKYVKGVNMSNSKNMGLMFSGSGIETIEEPLDISQVTTTQNAFACDNLREIRFVSGSIKVNIDFSRCAKLSAQSVQSIIDGLATVTEAKTLTLNSGIILTDEQKSNITAKGWTLA